MTSKVARRNLVILPIVLVLSILLITTTALAATKLIKAKSGGVVKIADGVLLKIEKGSLQEDTLISAEMMWGDDYIGFEFGPDDTVFSEPAKLRIGLDVIDEMGLDSLTLFGERGEKIKPDISKKYVEYRISHFSIYYYRRR